MYSPSLSIGTEHASLDVASTCTTSAPPCIARWRYFVLRHAIFVLLANEEAESAPSTLTIEPLDMHCPPLFESMLEGLSELLSLVLLLLLQLLLLLLLLLLLPFLPLLVWVR